MRVARQSEGCKSEFGMNALMLVGCDLIPSDRVLYLNLQIFGMLDREPATALGLYHHTVRRLCMFAILPVQQASKCWGMDCFRGDSQKAQTEQLDTMKQRL